jgi:hypothetical protein
MEQAERTERQGCPWELAFQERRLVPFLGAGLLPSPGAVPASLPELASHLAAKVTPPGRIRNNAYQVAQFIESRRHRKTLDQLMQAAFAADAAPAPLYHRLAALAPPLICTLWYDETMAQALREAGGSWGQVQGMSKANRHDGAWFRYVDAAGQVVDEQTASLWTTLLYAPLGTARGGAVISDADFVEVLTEIDIQTPIPAEVQKRRSGCGFLFLGMSFADQTQRIFARQIIKRSAGPHGAVLPLDLTRNEQRFIAQLAIQPLDDLPDCLGMP